MRRIHSRIFRWDGSGTAAVELGNLGTNFPTVTTVTAHAQAINTAGIAVGYARKWDGSVNKGYRAVRWDASATAATELGNLGTDPSGVTYSLANAINDAGTAVGVARKYDGSGSDMGLRAVRWDASGTAATELANLGANNSSMATVPLAINNAGTAVGFVAKYDENGYIVDSSPCVGMPQAPRPSWKAWGPTRRATGLAKPGLSMPQARRSVFRSTPPSAGTPRAPPRPYWRTSVWPTGLCTSPPSTTPARSSAPARRTAWQLPHPLGSLEHGRDGAGKPGHGQQQRANDCRAPGYQ